MYARKRLDLQWKDMFFGLGYASMPRSRRRVERDVESRFEGAGHALATYSVRSGFDLLLSSLNWSEGSEVIMTAITIPDMPRIVRHHGLVPVPIAVDCEAVAPDLLALERAIGPKTRAIVVAHVFGTRVDLKPIAALAKKHDLLLIEDCAQSYDGKPPATPSLADVSMFSFGTIKTATAFGGAVFVFRDARLRDALRAGQNHYGVASRRTFAQKLLKYMLLMVITAPWLYALFVWGLKLSRRDHDQFVRSATRGFRGPDFFQAIRQRPCSAQLALLDRQLRRYNPERVRARQARGDEIAAQLAPEVRYYGSKANEHIYWLFALVVENPVEVIDALRTAGFDATNGSSTLVVIEGKESSEPALARSREEMKKIVYVPVYPELPQERLRHMAQVINDTVRINLPRVPYIWPRRREKTLPLRDSRRACCIGAADDPAQVLPETLDQAVVHGFYRNPTDPHNRELFKRFLAF